MIPCDICGKLGHAWYDCPLKHTKPAGWKPDRLKKLRGRSSTVEQGRSKAKVAGSSPAALSKKSTAAHPRSAREGLGQYIPEAGTQAPPADTPKRGRPKVHDDRKAYNAAKQREYRARKKEKT
jgi:hypothetical protein